MTLYLVNYDCDDYYCEGEHFVGVFTTEELARAAIELHREKGGSRYWFRKKYEVTPVTVDEVKEW